ncbi:MAG: PilZ domain-containing protein [Terriglobia bacterium]|jgi:hypothetical protein
MASKPVRRSDRVVVEIPIVVTGGGGVLPTGQVEGRTAVVSRYGAKVMLRCRLDPDQRILIRCAATAGEAEARVVGDAGRGTDGTPCYGIAFLADQPGFWGIEFPSITESEGAVGRVLLECAQCHTRELVYLNEIEADVLDASATLSRRCGKCAELTVWKGAYALTDETLAVPVARPGGFAPPPTDRGADQRRHARLDLEVPVCVRHAQRGEEVVKTINVSRGGFRFRSRNRYREGTMIEAALPYSPGGANIFAPGKIVYAAPVPGGDMNVYGVMFVSNRQGWPDR